MTVYLEYNGKPKPRSELVWLKRASCGCYSGVARADAFEAVTAEAALREAFCESAAQYKRAIADGFTIELRDFETYRANNPLRNECPHTPKYGIGEKPEGYRWAGAYWRARTTHLVKGEREDRFTPQATIAADSREALCGARARYRWDSIFTDGAVHCRRCEAKARELAES